MLVGMCSYAVRSVKREVALVLSPFLLLLGHQHGKQAAGARASLLARCTPFTTSPPCPCMALQYCQRKVH